jgi:hypothetical protein
MVAVGVQLQAPISTAYHCAKLIDCIGLYHCMSRRGRGENQQSMCSDDSKH